MSPRSSSFGSMNKSYNLRTCRRCCSGTTAAEMPLAMWIMILGMCFPMLMLATMTMRFGFFWNAAREAAQQAARCQTFQNDTGAGASSVTTATKVANLAAQAFTGISIVPPVNVYVLQTNVNTRVSQKGTANTALVLPADITNNIYDVQVELNGEIEPLIRSPNNGILGSIPGLTGPFPVVVRAQYNSEVPQGLNQ